MNRVTENSQKAIPAASRNTKKQKNGLINKTLVRKATFTVVVICLGISVLSCILAIWDVTNGDSLWRTVATSIVTGVGMMLFSSINLAYGTTDE